MMLRIGDEGDDDGALGAWGAFLSALGVALALVGIR
jgi:hypothetical protein